MKNKSWMKLKAAPGRGVAEGGKPGTPSPTYWLADVEMPEPTELDPSNTRVSALLIGDSGTGTTHAIGRLFAAGYNGLIVAIEPKAQAAAKYRPPTLFLGAPIVTPQGVRPPAPAEMYSRLIQFKDRLGTGKYREFKGKPLDFIAIDGFLELGEVIYRYWKANKPQAASTGSDNSFAMWVNIAEKSVDFFKSLRDAAGMASRCTGCLR